MSRDFGDKIRKITNGSGVVQGSSYIKTLLREYDKECNFKKDYNEHFGRYLAFSNLEYATRGIDSRLSSKFEKLAKSEAEIAELISSNKQKYSDRKKPPRGRFCLWKQSKFRGGAQSHAQR